MFNSSENSPRNCWHAAPSSSGVSGSASVCCSGFGAVVVGSVADTGEAMSTAIMIIARNLIIYVPYMFIIFYVWPHQYGLVKSSKVCLGRVQKNRHARRFVLREEVM